MPAALAIAVPFRTRAASFQMDTLDVEARTVRATVSSGSRVRLPWWMAPGRAQVDGDFFFEELAIGREHVEGFEFFNSGRAPALDTHGHSGDGFSVLKQLGHVMADSVEFVQDSEAPQGVRMDCGVEFAEGEEIDRFLRDMAKGVRGHNWSVGFNVHRFADVTTVEDEAMVLRAILWEPKEFSPTALGADEGARTRASGHEPTRCILIPSDRPDSLGRLQELVQRSAAMNWKDQIRQLVESAKLDAAFAETLLQSLSEADLKGDAAVEEARKRIATKVEETRRSGPAPEPEPADPSGDPEPAPQHRFTQADLDAAAQRALDQAHENHTAIRTAVHKAGLDTSFADELIGRRLSPDQARAAILDRLESRSAAGLPTSSANPAVTVTEDALDKTMAGVQNALENRCRIRTRNDDGTLGARVTVNENGRRFRSLSLLEMGREIIRTRGWDMPDSRSKVFEMAMQRARAGGGHGTSDFPEVLANVAGLSLRQGYEASPMTWLPIATRNDAPDFKQQARVQLGQGTQVEKVTEHGEFKRGTVGESAEKYTLATYGKIFAFTRQAMINDQTDAFGRLPMMFGRNVAENQSDLVWAILTANANMGDGVALFAAGHNNDGSGALGLTALSTGRATMRKQTEIDGRRINVIPRYLIVPAALETTAEQITASRPILDNQGTPTDENPFSTLVPIAEPRLDTDSAVKWYLSGDPGQIDVIEYAHLEGEGDGPTLETREGWEVDGMEFKVRDDFAAAPLDFRGLYRSSGV